MNDSLFQINLEPLERVVHEAASRAISEALKGFSGMQQAKAVPELLTRQEAAKKLKITLPTLSDWTKRKLLKSYTIGGRIYYKSEELEKALTQIP